MLNADLLYLLTPGIVERVHVTVYLMKTVVLSETALQILDSRNFAFWFADPGDG